MVKIRWIITDDIKDVDLNEFNTEWNGIYGCFEMCINNEIIGFCPDRELFDGEEWNEDILYWLTKLSDGIIQLNNSQEYEIRLLCMNLAKLVLKKDDRFCVSLVNCNTDEVFWSETLMIQEWCNEVMANVERFIAEIRRLNPVLLEAKLVKKLIKIKNTLDCNGVEYL